MALIVMCPFGDLAGGIGSNVWLRSSACICDFSSTHSTIAWSDVQPDYVADLVDKIGIGRQFERASRWD